MKNRPSRTGFTLPEVLVTVAIVAVLAAIVVPTVTSQIGKGDDTNLTTNVESARTAITAFVSDVRKFPQRLQHLIIAPVAADVDVTGGTYGASAVAKWKGPYQVGSLKAEPGAGSLVKSDSILAGLGYFVDSLADTSFVTANGRGAIGLLIGGVTSRATARHIDSLIDAGTDSTAGSLRWHASNVAGDPTNSRLILILMGRN